MSEGEARERARTGVSRLGRVSWRSMWTVIGGGNLTSIGATIMRRGSEIGERVELPRRERAVGNGAGAVSAICRAKIPEVRANNM